MKKLFAIGMMGLLLLPFNAPKEPTTSSNGTYQFVGYSAESVLGTAGIFTLNRACAATYPNSRICNTKEVFETINPPVVEGDGWIQPYIIGINSGFIDFTGIVNGVQNLSCGSWDYPGHGLILLSSGAVVEGEACNRPRRVACCAP